MITTGQLNEIEYAMKNGTAVVIDTQFVTDVRALMAENVELHATLDKVKESVDNAMKMLDGVGC